MSSFDGRSIQPDASILNTETGEFKPKEPQVNIPPGYSAPTKEEALLKLFDDSPAEKAYKVIVFTIITVLTFGLVLIFGTVRRALFPKDRNR
jgi:hypothetical protein